MKKTGAKKSADKKAKTDKTSGTGAKKASKLKPIKSKEVKRSKNPKAFDEDDDFNPDDVGGGLDDFDAGVDLDDDDDF